MPRSAQTSGIRGTSTLPVAFSPVITVSFRACATANHEGVPNRSPVLRVYKARIAPHDIGYMNLDFLVEFDQHFGSRLNPFMRTVIFLFKFTQNFVACEQRAVLSCTIHLLPHAGKYVQRIVANPCVQESTRVDAVWHPLHRQPRVVALHVGEMLQANLQVIGHIAGSDAFSIETFNDQASKGGPGAR